MVLKYPATRQRLQRLFSLLFVSICPFLSAGCGEERGADGPLRERLETGIVRLTYEELDLRPLSDRDHPLTGSVSLRDSRVILPSDR